MAWSRGNVQCSGANEWSSNRTDTKQQHAVTAEMGGDSKDRGRC
jgi:hypothetical protein